MKLPFLSRRVRFFGNVAIMILCAVFFLVPFAFRGARMSLRTVRNDVADWLPDDFPETQELEWFRDHFAGSQFVVISWPGCSEDDDRYHLLLDKIRAESLERTHEGEARLAHEIGDREGLHTTGDYHEDWGSHREKWLMGHRDQWYFVTREGELYQWTGESNLIGWVKRGVERLLHGKNRAEGTLIKQFGEPENNIYYKDPRRLAGRFFEGVMTGPDLFNELAGPNGSLLRSRAEDDEAAALDARILAHQRLTGLVFGPTPAPGFAWTPDAFWEAIPEKTRESLPEPWRQIFSDYVEEVVASDFDGDRDAFLKAGKDDHLECWYRLFDRLSVESPVEPPARQTCLIVTLNTDVAQDLSRVVGRPVLGKPRGRLLELATGEVRIPEEDLHLGGPPVDNVAIDEEGTITLVRLVSLSVLVGVTLAYLSFRSVNVTFMVFFIGSVSAVSSMGIVWYLGSSPDAVLMSMPALVYVLGLSGAIHIVNYYREAAHAHGPRGASEAAVRHGWFPCTLAAFTTSLGLISLYVSNLTPIKKFGLFSAFGTMATVMLLFTYLPAALQIWPPGYKRLTESGAKAGGIHAWIGRCWESVCEFIIRRHAWVTVACILMMAVIGVGIFKIETSVQLLKLFDKDAKVITDYEWLEGHLGRLVPMELVVRVDEAARYEDSAITGRPLPADDEIDELKVAKQLNFLERMELTARIRSAVEEVFGEDGAQIVGHGLSTDVFVLPENVTQTESPVWQERSTISGQIEANYQQLLQTDTLRVDSKTGEELWRISLRLGAFNDVDYGRFVFDLKRVVEPILTAYRHRNLILDEVYAARESAKTESASEGSPRIRILLLGWANPQAEKHNAQLVAATGGDTGPAANLESSAIEVDQTKLYCDTLGDTLLNRGFRFSSSERPDRLATRVVPEIEQQAKLLADRERFTSLLETYDCVVLIRDHELLDAELIESHAKRFIDARDHVFRPQQTSDHAASPTALEIKNDPGLPEHDEANVGVTYTGIVPIVYKAQRTLLRSLMDSICLAFVMIAVVMMILLRDWKARWSLSNTVNVSGGMVSMLPNVFPVILIFGAMGHMRVVVDIGSMMTASVAMGIAVDDTIHFMNWFRVGLREGLSRLDAIRLAYKRVATAMTQTTLIAGFGLSVFALSTFTPTQRFGVLMLTLLFAALIGDLIFLPALLAGPLGRFFALKKVKPTPEGQQIIAADMGSDVAEALGDVGSDANSEQVREIRRGTVGSPHLDGRAGDKSRSKSASSLPPGSAANDEER